MSFLPPLSGAEGVSIRCGPAHRLITTRPRYSLSSRLFSRAPLDLLTRGLLSLVGEDDAPFDAPSVAERREHAGPVVDYGAVSCSARSLRAALVFMGISCQFDARVTPADDSERPAC